MTISTTTNKVTYNGDDSTVAFATTYRFLENGDLKVYVDETLQTITTDYSVSGAGEDSGGTVTFVTAPSTGEVVTIKNDPPKTQETDYVENDPFPAESHEEALDKLTLLCQSLGEENDRSIKFAIDSTTSTTVPEPSANTYLGWDSTGTDLENKTLADASIIAIPVTVLNGGTGSTTAAGARSNLGAEQADPDILKADVSDTLTVGFQETVGVYTSNASLSVADGSLKTFDVTSGGGIALLSGVGRVTLLLTGGGSVSYAAGYDNVIGEYDSTKTGCAAQAINDGSEQWLIFANTES